MDLSCPTRHDAAPWSDPGSRLRHRGRRCEALERVLLDRCSVLGAGPEHRARRGLRVGESSCMVVDERGRFNRVDRQSRGRAAATFANTRGGFAALDCTVRHLVPGDGCLRKRSAAGRVARSWPRTRPVGGRVVAADCAGSTCMAAGPGRVDLAGSAESGTWGAQPRRPTCTPSVDRSAPASTRCFSLAGSTATWQWNGTGWCGRQRPCPVDLGYGHAAGTARRPRSAWPWVTGRTRRGSGTALAWVSRRSRAAARRRGRGQSTASARRSAWRWPTARPPCTALRGGGRVPRSVYGISGLACRSTTLCFSLSGGTLVAFDGTAWGLTSMVLGPDVSSGHLELRGHDEVRRGRWRVHLVDHPDTSRSGGGSMAPHGAGARGPHVGRLRPVDLGPRRAGGR